VQRTVAVGLGLEEAGEDVATPSVERGAATADGSGILGVGLVAEDVFLAGAGWLPPPSQK
jgi:hypothetical protein